LPRSAALARRRRGVADFVFLSVGTGMGAGLVLGGELHRGRNGAAGEIDFALVGVARRSTVGRPVSGWRTSSPG
jgi:predicted NBD/HSP70 family sugar kinase